jgi:DNA-binding MarR family transcriptional regulator
MVWPMNKSRLPSLDECRSMGALCASYNLRVSARVVTHHFNSKLEPSGLNATQFTILAVLHALGPLGLGAVAQEVMLEPSTMTRNLAVLKKRGWVSVAPGGSDRRVREVGLTPKGKQRLAQAYPAWQTAQREIAEPFGARRYQQLLGSLKELTAPARRSARQQLRAD